MDKRRLTDLGQAHTINVQFRINDKKSVVGDINSQMLQRAAECEHRQAVGQAMASYCDLNIQSAHRKCTQQKATKCCGSKHQTKRKNKKYKK